MLVELDVRTAMVVSGGDGSNSTVPDYCSGFNGVALGPIVAGAVAFVGVFIGMFGGGSCCYRFKSYEDIQNTITTGGGCCGGYLGRLAIHRATGASCWMCAALPCVIGALGLGCIGLMLSLAPESTLWECGGNPIA